MPPNRASSSRVVRREAHRRAILARAKERFSRRGFRATQVADIARAAGVAHGTVYRHFESKLDLFRAVVTATVDDVIAAAAEAARGGDLAALTAAAVDALRSARPALGPEAREVTPDAVARLEAALEAAAASTLDERQRRLWRAALLEAARDDDGDWAETIAGLFVVDASSSPGGARRATGWR